MTFVVTGATGFVGRQVLRGLLERGFAVRVLVRDPSKLTKEARSGQVEIVQTHDLFSEAPDRLAEMLADADTLIHAAWFADPDEYLTSARNLDCLRGTLDICQTFGRIGGRRIVGIGSCAEYDLSAGVISVDTPLEPSSLYAVSKAAAFQVLRTFAAQYGLSFAWCRLFYLYGEGEDQRRLVPYLRRQLGLGQDVLLSHGEQVRDYLDVTEAGRKIAEVAAGEDTGAVNICSGEGITVRRLAESIADEYGRRDLLRFGARPESYFDPPHVVGIPGSSS